jgi:uncharacterized protein YrzB (UPF0473 family)
MENNENVLIVIDEHGKEIPMEIVYIYEDEDSLEKYVYYVDPKDEEGEVFVSAYDDEGNLRAIEDAAEWAKLDAIFETYVLSEENKAQA